MPSHHKGEGYGINGRTEVIYANLRAESRGRSDERQQKLTSFESGNAVMEKDDF